MAKCAGFKPEAIVPKSDKITALDESKAERAKQREVMKTLSKTIKREKAKAEKLKKKALKLSNEDLCDIIGMKQHLAAQYELKKSAADGSDKSEA